MSLINDALKRARDAQQNAPRETPELEFRPVDLENQPNAAAKSSLGILLPVALAVMGLLLGLLVWQRIKDHRDQVPREITVRAVNPGPTPAAAARPEPQATVAIPQPAGLTAPPAAQTAAVSAQASPQAPEAAGAVTGSAPPNGEPASTNVPVLAPAAPPPKPALPKLQGVVWNPSRPSALISGQALFIGERIGDYKLTRITPTSATLTRAGQTIVLTMP